MRPWPPATGPSATFTRSENRPSPKPWLTDTNGSAPPNSPGAWPSLPTPNYADAIRTRRSSPCAPPKQPLPQHQAFRAEVDERSRLLMPGEDPAWGDLGTAIPSWQASDQDAILKPPKPDIIPAARILQLASEHDTEPDHEAAD